MKKVKLVGLLLSMMTLCASVLAGCGLITVNRYNYLNQVVASVVEKDTKHKIEIYKKDLIDGYNNYGYYYTQQGAEPETAYKNTLDLLTKRKIVVYECEKLYPTLDEKEKTYIWQQTLEAIESKFDAYLNNLLGTSNDDETASDKRAFTQYNPTAKLAEVDRIRRETLEKEVLDDFTYDYARDFDNKEDREILYTAFDQYVNRISSQSRTTARNNYLKALKKDEEGLKLSTETKSVFMREIEKLYKNEYENYRITQYEEHLREELTVDPGDKYLSPVTPQEVLDQYAGKVKSAYTQYKIEGDSSYSSSVLSDPSNVYYYLEDKDYTGENKATQYFQVGHILFKYSDEKDSNGKTAADKFAELEAMENKDSEAYKNGISALKGLIKPTIREFKNGEWVESGKTYDGSIDQLAHEIKADIEKRDASVISDDGKFAKFREYVYMYNDDPGQINNMTSGHNYTLGVNYSETDGDLDYKVYGDYVTNFKNAAVELFKQGQLGAVSEPVLTENGMHILIYLGPIQNIFSGINSTFGLANVADDKGEYPISKLASSYPNPFYAKSYFDIIYEELNVDNFSTLQEDYIDNLTGGYNINYNGSHYQDLF